jgi:hypothetical protein
MVACQKGLNKEFRQQACITNERKHFEWRMELVM